MFNHPRAAACTRSPAVTISGGASGTDKKLISGEWQWLKVRRRGHEISDLRSVKVIITGAGSLTLWTTDSPCLSITQSIAVILYLCLRYQLMHNSTF
ncbi:hypothetical protein TIFTF001_020495 [Ficus carica]|uniref:Uncharacterized protein n=1 Tax=Ficus carica TaxID=3494 RepID=A0AA88DB58_FICCA|nr:hypothetical protein TIFTF001_020495 [Ficus carica]